MFALKKTPTFQADVVIHDAPMDYQPAGHAQEATFRVLQTNLQCNQCDVRNKYLMAVVLDGKEFFYTSDDLNLWHNGMAGKTKLAEAFRLFSSAEDAREFLLDHQPSKATHVTVYSMMSDGGKVTLIPHLRVGLLSAA